VGYKWCARLVTMIAVTVAGACAAPLQRASLGGPPPTAPAQSLPAVSAQSLGRPTIGIALGGGSARGLAHVGVIRWLEEHRIPIDVTAGTSMGGLVGGAFASGMDAAELDAFMRGLDWDQLFGASAFAFKNIRRKTDARAFPSRLEFGLKGGIVPPTALNNGEYIELLFGRIAAPYHAMDSFDELPTPFRAVAVDLITASQVVMERGSLADAMRATMSLPLIFPPVHADGRVLVDGGAMNNVPADVARQMGADRVIAINVGNLEDSESLNLTMLGLAGATIDAMMRASTLKALASADVVVNVPLTAFGSLDWRRAPELVVEGYRAAEAARDALLPLAVSEAEYEAWRRARLARRRTALPTPTFARSEGFVSSDARRLEVLLARHVGVPIDLDLLEIDITELTGLDRYETITWRLVRGDADTFGLLVRGRPKPYAPPFMMLGLNLENTTSNDFRITTTARYLSFDVLGSGSELRLDGTIGSNPGIGGELYRPIGSTPLFVAPYAGVGTQTLNIIEDDAVMARYGQTRLRTGVNLGINLGAWSDLRSGMYVGRSSATIEVGDPGLPEVKGKETGAELVWRLDTQDSPAVPSLGVFSRVRLSHAFDSPDLSTSVDTFATRRSLTQLEGGASQFWMAGSSGRVFVYGATGTSFGDTPLPTYQFALGSPFRLGSYAFGELRGAHYYVATGGYLRQIARLPDFLGGPIFLGGWLENGDAFNTWSDAKWRTNGSVGVVADTLFGPVIIAGSSGFDGRWRTFLGVGRLFR
jgi:NTE family protein